MDSNDTILTFELHYFMDQPDWHEMDAVIHNRCGANVINVIKNLADVMGVEIQLDYVVSLEGGVKDKLKLVIKKTASKVNGIPHDIFIVLISALLGHFISPAPSVDESQQQLNRAEVIEKIKNGQYTDEEIAFIITGDKKYIANRNSFYRNLDKEPHVTKVQCRTTGGGLPDNGSIPEIEKKDFQDQIIAEQTNTETQKYSGTTVMVLIPVLSKESDARWKGLFNNQTIPFKIADKDFLKEVFNKDVHFVAGTSLRCDFTLVTESKYDENGNLESQSRYGIVDNVTSCYDGEVLVHHTKRYKKAKADKRQLSLFDDDNFK